MLRRKPTADGLVRRTNSARAKTSPAKVLEEAAREALDTDLKPPRTPAVQHQLLEGGPTTTMLDLALGILQRLGEVDDNDPEEIQFLEDCLKLGHAKTTLPCALVESSGPSGDVQDMLLNMYASRNTLTRKSRETVSRLWFHPETSECEEDSDEDAEIGSQPMMCRMPSTVLDAREVQQLLDNEFDNWSFDMFRLAKATSGRALFVGGQEVFRRNNLFYSFNIDADKVKSFLTHVEAHYHKSPQVPYHNSTHGADVTQSIHAMLGDIGFHEFFDTIGVLSLVVSAVIHDMGHDGHTNNFHVNAQDEMALTYNDRSVLENYHVSQAYRIMSSEPNAAFLAGLPHDQFTMVRKMIIEEVLGTDMANHFSHLGSLKAISQKLPHDDPDAWMDDTEAASALRVMMLHACDVSNPVKSLSVSDRWASLLRTEFFQQGDIERGLGLPISPLCDRETVKFASSQVGFMQFIVRPTFEVLAPLQQNVADVMLKHMDANLEVWQERKEKEAREPSSSFSFPKTTASSAPGTIGNLSLPLDPL